MSEEPTIAPVAFPEGEPLVRLRNKVFLERLKAPFVPSGFSYKGAIEIKPISGRLTCHECGKSFFSLAGHLVQTHKISSTEYRTRHGLSGKSSLVSERTRKAMADAESRRERPDITQFSKLRDRRPVFGPKLQRKRIALKRFEQLNERGTCPAQLENKLIELAARTGRVPTIQEIEAAGLHINSIKHALGAKDIAAVIATYGLNSSRAKPGPKAKYTREFLSDLLRSFYVGAQRLPTISEYGRNVLPSQAVFRNYFGSMENAYEAAGLGLVARQRSGSGFPNAKVQEAS